MTWFRFAIFLVLIGLVVGQPYKLKAKDRDLIEVRWYNAIKYQKQ